MCRNACIWSSGECNGWPVSCHEPLDTTVYETDSPSHWNPIGRTKTALPAVISPDSTLQPASSPHCVFIHSHKKIFGTRFKRFIVPFVFTFLKLS